MEGEDLGGGGGGGGLVVWWKRRYRGREVGTIVLLWG